VQQDEDKIAWLRMDAKCIVLVLFRVCLFLIAAVVETSHQLKPTETDYIKKGFQNIRHSNVFLIIVHQYLKWLF